MDIGIKIDVCEIESLKKAAELIIFTDKFGRAQDKIGCIEAVNLGARPLLSSPLMPHTVTHCIRLLRLPESLPHSQDLSTFSTSKTSLDVTLTCVLLTVVGHP